MIPIQDQNPRRRPPYVTVTLIALNVIVFLFEPLSSNETWIPFADTWAVIPDQLTSNLPAELFTIFSAMFLHGGWSHLGGNMLYLWIFGDNIEDRIGPVRYLIFYLLCGVIATIAQVAMDPDSTIPNVGASGAIAGVLGAYLVLFPMVKVLTMVPILLFRRIYLPAVVVLGLWIALQFFQIVQQWNVSIDTGGVAFMAHAGGFVAGMILIWAFGGRYRVRQEEIHLYDRYRY